MMKNVLAMLILSCFLFAGCDALRFAPTEVQKQNAWLHKRTAIIAAETAKSEKVPDQLQQLTKLSELQSRAFTSYYGLPKEFPQAGTAEEIIAESNFQLAKVALHQSTDRPDVWQLADNALELAIAVSALLGGVYGTRFVWFLKQARTKSKALQEVIAGNELFKSQNRELSSTFKQAHKTQSPETRQIVAQMKS